jgi:hypothetical protein
MALGPTDRSCRRRWGSRCRLSASSPSARPQRAAPTADGYANLAFLFDVSLCFLTVAGCRALELAMGSI